MTHFDAVTKRHYDVETSPGIAAKPLPRRIRLYLLLDYRLDVIHLMTCDNPHAQVSSLMAFGLNEHENLFLVVPWRLPMLASRLVSTAEERFVQLDIASQRKVFVPAGHRDSDLLNNKPNRRIVHPEQL